MANSKNYVRYLDLIPPFYRSRLDHYSRIDPQDLEETERNDPDIINLRMGAMEGIELLLTL